MSDTVSYEPLEPVLATEAVLGAPDAPEGLDRLREVPVEIACEIGRTQMTIGEALALAPGAIVGLNRLAGDPVDLLVNGRPIARGEVVVIDEEFGLRITDVVAGSRNVEDEAAAQAALAAEAEAELMQHVDPGPGFGPQTTGGLDPLGQAPVDPLGAAPYQGDDITLSDVPGADVELS